ncbi:hypothetical protein DFP72DRAFT_611630 [Ephemerocybe angulata]|uniref:Uncharacterized protein n=1 Tax=Ephemerocybe angulata TaxID=980116 RepID=A0A8H6HJU1_9AGAR|nr:hypothetical protein DFP72DRAFT_611630 [Tulosesus angulatus]
MTRRNAHSSTQTSPKMFSHKKTSYSRLNAILDPIIGPTSPVKRWLGRSPKKDDEPKPKPALPRHLQPTVNIFGHILKPGHALEITLARRKRLAEAKEALYRQGSFGPGIPGRFDYKQPTPLAIDATSAPRPLVRHDSSFGPRFPGHLSMKTGLTAASQLEATEPPVAEPVPQETNTGPSGSNDRVTAPYTEREKSRPEGTEGLQGVHALEAPSQSQCSRPRPQA